MGKKKRGGDRLRPGEDMEIDYEYSEDDPDNPITPDEEIPPTVPIPPNLPSVQVNNPTVSNKTIKTNSSTKTLSKTPSNIDTSSKTPKNISKIPGLSGTGLTGKGKPATVVNQNRDPRLNRNANTEDKEATKRPRPQTLEISPDSPRAVAAKKTLQAALQQHLPLTDSSAEPSPTMEKSLPLPDDDYDSRPTIKDKIDDNDSRPSGDGNDASCPTISPASDVIGIPKPQRHPKSTYDKSTPSEADLRDAGRSNVADGTDVAPRQSPNEYEYTSEEEVTLAVEYQRHIRGNSNVNYLTESDEVTGDINNENHNVNHNVNYNVNSQNSNDSNGPNVNLNPNPNVNLNANSRVKFDKAVDKSYKGITDEIKNIWLIVENSNLRPELITVIKRSLDNVSEKIYDLMKNIDLRIKSSIKEEIEINNKKHRMETRKEINALRNELGLGRKVATANKIANNIVVPADELLEECERINNETVNSSNFSSQPSTSSAVVPFIFQAQPTSGNATIGNNNTTIGNNSTFANTASNNTRRSFAEVVSNGEILPKHTPINMNSLTVQHRFDSKNTYATLKAQINPVEHNFEFSSKRILDSGTVAIKFPDNANLLIFENAVKTLVDANGEPLYEIRKSKPLYPSLLIKYIDKQDSLADVNLSIERFTGEKVIYSRFTKNQSRTYQNAVVSLSPASWRKCILAKKIKIVWMSCPVENFIPVQRCYRCYAFGHKRENCKYDFEKNPLATDLNDENYRKCCACYHDRLNFQQRNPNGNWKGNLNHRHNNPACPSLIEATKRTKLRIDYIS